MKRILAAAALAALAACATATPYQPASNGGFGYTETRVETNRYTLTFAGNSLTERDTVETYLLYRAAELTLQNGFDYFVVTQRAVDPRREVYSTGPRYSFAYYDYFSPRWGWRPWYDPFWNDVNIREVTRYQARAEIVQFKGQKPASDPNAFDARDVQANLQGKIVPPAPAR